MKRLLIAMVVFCVGTLAVMGQQSSGVNSSRSNIKNNLPVFSQGPDGKVRCTVSGTGCTKDQVEQLNTALTSKNAAADRAVVKGFEDKQERPREQAAALSTSKSGIKSIALAPDGSLACVTNDGKQQPCTAAHVADLNNAAAAMRGINDPIGGVGVGLGKKPNPSK
jgi:hypothetical protein